MGPAGFRVEALFAMIAESVEKQMILFAHRDDSVQMQWGTCRNRRDELVIYRSSGDQIDAARFRFRLLQLVPRSVM